VVERRTRRVGPAALTSAPPGAAIAERKGIVSISSTSAAEEALRQLEGQLDLSDIRFKLANPEEGPAPDPTEVEQMEAEYRKFLALHLAHSERAIVPCKLVDEMWHRHILDTRAYADDCQRIFGFFLHHFPYFGLRGPADEQALKDAYVDTLELYREAFGSPPEGTWISRDARRRCRTACKPVRCR